MLNLIFSQISVVSKIVDHPTFDNLSGKLLTKLIGLGGKIIIVTLAYIVGTWLISLLRKLVKRILLRKKIDKTVASFVNSLVNSILRTILIIVIVGILGIPATSIAALLAAAGLAIGMAMKDNLSNFAGGVMLLMNKPFEIGSYIAAQGQEGTVDEIGILYTVLITPDGRTVFLSNGPLSTGSIINYSLQKNRRIDISLNINNGNDADELKQIIADIISKNAKTLEDPVPFVGITKINNENFDITVRVWVQNSDYVSTSIDINESIYKILSDKKIFIPSQLTVKMAEH